MSFTYYPQQSCNVIAALLLNAVLHIDEGAHDESRTVNITVCQIPGATDVSVRVDVRCNGIPLSQLDTFHTFLNSPQWSATATLQRIGSLNPADLSATWLGQPLRVPYAMAVARVFGGEIRWTSINGQGISATYYCPTGVN
jgi:hypothetical protein